MKKLKLTFIADTHHYSTSLGTSGRAYELRSGSDQKCLAETGAIIDAAFEKIANSDTDAVMIAGDLTNDGEIICHEEFREKLYKLKEKKRVYVITATHDWCCDENPRKFDGDKISNDVPTMPHEKLRDFYADFGPNDAISEFITHLGTCSYVVDLDESTRLLALNDDQDGTGGAGFTEEHFKWIEKQIKDANDCGKTIISMQHHLLIAHIHPLLTGGGTCVKNREYVASRLADAGLKYAFVGHSHIQDIARFTSEKGNTLTEVNVGSLCGYPAPIVNVTVENSELTVDLDYLDRFDYNGIQNANEYLREHLYAIVDRVVKGAAYGDKREFVDRFTALQLNGEKLAKYRFIIKPIAKFVDTSTVKKAYKRINLLTFGKGLKKEYALPFADKKIMDFVHEVLCNFIDGTRAKHSANSDYYKLVTSVVSIPSKIMKKNNTFKELNECIHILLVGNNLNDYPTKL